MRAVKWEVRYLIFASHNLVIIVSLAKNYVSRFRHLMCQVFMQIAHGGSYGCTRVRIYLHLTSQLARYPPWRTTTCVFRRCVNPAGAVSRVVCIPRKGRISARYRRAQILVRSTCIHIGALAAPRGWNCAATVYTPGIHVQSWAICPRRRGALSSECPIWKIYGTPDSRA